MKRVFVWLSAVVLSVGLVACQQEEEVEVLPTIAEIAVAEGLDSLVAALVAAELDGVFADAEAEEGPFTVFAPSEQAFATLLAALELDTLEDLIELIGIENVVSVLLFHVVPGSFLAEDVVAVASFTTLLEDFTLDVSVDLAGVTVSGFNQALVVETDFVASNGVLHVIDTVLLPLDPATLIPAVE